MGRGRVRIALGGAALAVACVALVLMTGPCGDAADRGEDGAREAAPGGRSEEPARGLPGERPRALRAAPTPVAAPEAPPEEEADAEDEEAAPRAHLRVLCVRADTGEPIPDLRVEVRWPGRSPWGRTGPDGVWVAPRPPASAKVRAGEEAEVNGRWYADTEAVVPEGAEEVRVEVPTTGVVAGTVVGEDGNGIRNIEVNVRSDGRLLARATTETTGDFAVRVPEGTQVEVDAHLFVDGLRHGASGPVVATTRGLVIRLLPDPLDAEVEVLVLDPDGRPVPGARVFGASRITVRGDVRISTTNPLPSPVSTETGSDGRARLIGLPRVPVSISARAPADRGAGLISATSPEVSALGQQVTLSLRRGWVLSGSAEFADGSLAVYATVRIEGEGGVEVASARTNNAARFAAEIPTESAGPFRVIVQRAQFRGEQRDVATGASAVRVVLTTTD